MKTITYDETQWQLVPKEPTQEMIGAIRNGFGWEAAYKAMLAAAPQLPEVDQWLPDEVVAIPRARLNEWWCQLLATDEVAEGWTTGRLLKVADEMREKFGATYISPPNPEGV